MAEQDSAGNEGSPDKKDATTVGNYFVANYPPFSFWTADQCGALETALQATGDQSAPLGLYIHIPFCRKRCDFCYFKVYTDKNAQDIHRYIDAVFRELDSWRESPLLQGRPLRFVYFGGGTPSYLSARQLRGLFEGLKARMPWDEVEEVTFEAEPGTLQESKLEVLLEMGVTRLSLGVENFDPEILELNNRAHRGEEIYRAYDFARSIDFPQINIDLISGMVGENDANWSAVIDETLRIDPDSVTIYQMEVPYNTTIYRRMKDGGEAVAPIADWETKRRWTDEAFRRLEEAGWTVGSAYTAKKKPDLQFMYRDALWTGADLLGIGVSSFGHLTGVHYQNEHTFDAYVERVEKGERPVHRALPLREDEKLIREFVLQMKLGRLGTQYFQDKFGVDVLDRFGDALQRHRDAGYLEVVDGEIRLFRHGLLQVDRLLHDFFLDEHRGARYA